MLQILEKALMDTVLGMGVVFCMLILIAAIIWCFKFIPMLEEKFKKKPDVPAPLAPAVSEDVALQEEELMDDLELTAVITAAIYASMGDEVPADGLVVKSIRKANRNAWIKKA